VREYEHTKAKPSVDSVLATNEPIRYEERFGDASYSVTEQPGAEGPDVELVIPQGEYFLLGDNRDNARDSRYIGTVPRERILGRVLLPH
jgi:signal peptidase I